MFYEEKSTCIINKIYSIGLGLLPLLAILDFNIQGITVERIFLIIFAFITAFKFMANHSYKIMKVPFLSVFIYCLIVAINIFFYESCGVFGFISLWMILLVDLAISPGVLLDFDILKNTVTFIAVSCSVLIMIQYVLFYGIGTYWNPIPNAIYRKDVINAYANFLATGLEGSLLRPSAIFLEPSHFAEYAILALVMQLFSSKEGLRKAIIISIGIVLCTSGLGIIATTIAWGIKIFGDRELSKNKKIIISFGVIVTIVITYFIMESIGVASLMLSKFSIRSDNSGFISRFGEVESVFKNWTVREYLIGQGFDSISDFWLPGYFSTIRQIGIVGLVAMFTIMIKIFKISNKMGKCIVIVYAWLLLVAEVSTMTYMVFYLSPACFLYLSSNYRYRN